MIAYRERQSSCEDGGITKKNEDDVERGGDEAQSTAGYAERSDDRDGKQSDKVLRGIWDDRFVRVIVISRVIRERV